MAAAILYDDVIAGAVFIGDLGTAATGTMPLSNLADPQPRVRTRWAGGVASIYIDLGAEKVVACLALISTNLEASADVQWRFGNDAGFSFNEYDTGAVFAVTSAAANGNVILVNPTSASGRYMLIDIASIGSGVLDIGRIVAGPLWRLRYAPAYGMEEGRQMLDRRDRNELTGAEFPVKAVMNPRTTRFNLPLITTAEATAEHRAILDTLGATGDALWVPNDALSQSELNRRCIWGGVAQPGSAAVAARSNFIAHSRGFTMTERG